MPLMTIFEPLFILLALIAIGTLVTACVLALTPRGVYRLGEKRCFDDWCLTVRNATRDSPTTYQVSIELSSRAKRVWQGEKGTVMYVTDSSGRRFDPIESIVPFDYKLAPGESIMATRRYAVPRDARGLKIVHVHEGGFPIGWFIIGENDWIHGPAVVTLDTGPLPADVNPSGV